MKKVLIATTNKDKYDTVCKIFRETIFPIDIYIIEKLTEDMKIPEKEEIGNNVETARTKALNAYNHLKNHNYGYIVGIDDAIKIKNKSLFTNAAEYVLKLSLLLDGVEIWKKSCVS